MIEFRWHFGPVILTENQKKHCHPFDEYTIVIAGQYTVCLEDGQEIVLNPGEEYFTPANTIKWGRCIANTRTIHAFGGKRVQ